MLSRAVVGVMGHDNEEVRHLAALAELDLGAGEGGAAPAALAFPDTSLSAGPLPLPLPSSSSSSAVTPLPPAAAAHAVSKTWPQTTMQRQQQQQQTSTLGNLFGLFRSGSGSEATGSISATFPPTRTPANRSATPVKATPVAPQLTRGMGEGSGSSRFEDALKLRAQGDGLEPSSLQPGGF